jgi:hypothetical protein
MSKTFTRLLGAAAVCAAVGAGMAYAQNSDPSMPAASTPANTQPSDQRFNTGSTSANSSSTASSTASTDSSYNTDGSTTARAPRRDRH